MSISLTAETLIEQSHVIIMFRRLNENVIEVFAGGGFLPLPVSFHENMATLTCLRSPDGVGNLPCACHGSSIASLFLLDLLSPVVKDRVVGGQ